MTNDAEADEGDPIGELMGYDKWPEDVAIAFDRARGVATLKYIKNAHIDFAAIVAEFRALEAEYSALLGDNEENIQQVRRITTEMLLQAAWDKDQPFDTCLKYWHDLQALGFYRLERRCLKTGLFAVICQHYGHADMGLGLLEPLIAELERLRAEPTATKQEVDYYDYELASLHKLRARLEAERG